MAKKTVKKPIVSAAAKPAAAPAPATMACNCNCDCHRHGFWHFVKKVIILAIVFLIGVAVCHFGCCKKRHMMMKHMSFDANGCLDMSKIKCPVKAERLMAADLNGDGCITKAELKEWRMAKFERMEAQEANEECPDEE